MISPGSVFIVRLDGANVCGWQVRIYKNDRKYSSRLFSDSVYGGKRKAQTAAKEYHKVCLASLPKKFRDRQEKAKRYGRAWGNGISYRNCRRSSGFVEQAWIGYYSHQEHGQVKGYFSCKRYGPRVAKRLAKHFRDTGIKYKAYFK